MVEAMEDWTLVLALTLTAISFCIFLQPFEGTLENLTRYVFLSPENKLHPWDVFQ